MAGPGRRRDAPAGQKQGVCYHFRSGKCSYGARCKYSHETLTNGSPEGSGAVRSRAPPKDPAYRQAQDDLHRFKQLLQQSPSTHGRLASDIGPDFFQTARKILDGDLGAAQEIVKLLAQDDGLAFVRYLAKNIIPNSRAHGTHLQLWQTQLKPFFETVTHERIVESAVLEQQLATIYNFMMGVNGDRARLLLGFATDLLSQVSAEQQIEITKLSLAVVYRMIDCNTNNIVAGVFDPVVKVLAATIHTLIDISQHDRLQMGHHLEYLNRRLEIGAALPFTASQKQATTQQATFQLDQDLPGQLSKDGPRHDNDHADIGDINILPTYDEIMSVRPEYLPTNDTSLFHKPGIMGRIDREFRLLREDTVGQLRDAVRRQIDAMKTPQHQRRQAQRDNTLRTYVYDGAQVMSLQIERPHGLSIDVRFKQPAPGAERKHRQEWWENSRRLQPGGLVCVTSSRNTAFFAVVSEQPNKPATQQGQTASGQREEDKPTLFGERDHAFVSLNLAEESRDAVYQLLRWSSRPEAITNRADWFLVEFPGVLLPSFRYTLEALQLLSAKPNLPFAELLAPAKPGSQPDTTTGLTTVQPPRYATKPGFVFDLACLSQDFTPLQTSLQNPLDPAKLSEHSALDPTQASALLSALSRSLALIQGPPGTGKSYTGEKIIKVLLANKGAAKLGPILCVCYTNHALDQLLEHLLDSGVERIIRIGSRSKSERLEQLNLRVVVQIQNRTKAEKSALYNFHSDLDSQAEFLNQTLAQLAALDRNSALEEYLAVHHVEHHSHLFGKIIDEEGFQKVVNDPTQRFKRWIRGGHPASDMLRSPSQLESAPLETMSAGERQRLYQHWNRQMRAPLVTQIQKSYAKFLSTSQERSKTMKDVDLRCLNKADVVGITTTGLARNISLLQRLHSKVLMCEEAGEVLEAHTITALLPTVEHAILIGDHLQLPPQTQNYELQSTHPRGARYSLDVSLFERLIKPPFHDDPRLPFCTLETQRRMHPSVSQLIRSTLYPRLVDGGAVTEYPEVVGMRKRLFWFDHCQPEDQARDSAVLATSRTNQFEIEMTIRLVQHLVRQGEYGPEDIAVITPYLGQLQRLRKQMSKIFEIAVGDRDLEELTAMDADHSENGTVVKRSALPAPVSKTTVLKSIRLATVDNFQGEEAKIVVISLVRSNAENRCGFLKTSNRINVLLSRAKHGMYVIGNSSTYGGVQMWSEVLDILRGGGNFGQSLDLCCPRHPETPIVVSEPDHFLQFAPEGGCLIPCDRRLACGHACIARCHAQVLHDAVKCLEPCPRPRKDCTHACPLVCGNQCPAKCSVRLIGTTLTLPCGHNFSSPLCWQIREVESIRCNEPVRHTISGCEHEIVEPCHVNVLSPKFQCPKSCGGLLACGHSCKKPCSQCRTRAEGVASDANHGECLQRCGRDFTTCRHRCSVRCHGDLPCPPCESPCDVKCSHSRCDKKCHEPCAPCAEQRCASHCPHVSCSMPCAAPCDWVPCTKRCTSLLECGHQCPSLCGEICPDSKFCQECGNDDVKQTIVDFIMGLRYEEISLDEDPCIFPDCGHFITSSNMDGVMDMGDHYQLDSNGIPIALAGQSVPFTMDGTKVKVCPHCRGSLRNIARYGRIVRRALLDESTKKFILWSNSRCTELGHELVNKLEDLSRATEPWKAAQSLPQAPSNRPSLPKDRLELFCKMNALVGGGRYTQLIRLWQEIQRFADLASIGEQPFSKVANFVRFASRSRALDFDESVLQVKSILQATCLQLKCELAILLDFVRLRKDLAHLHSCRISDVSRQLQECSGLIAVAEERGYSRELLEGHLFCAKFCIVQRGILAQMSDHDDGPVVQATSVEEQVHAMGDKAREHITQADALVKKLPSLAVFKSEVDATLLMLNNGTFYSVVSKDELRAVYAAMATEFRGTGHWYNCVNGHPFTVGECGMPMEEARCPECGQGVGGRNHVPTAGVAAAAQMDELARDLGGVAL
ncbi:uncharacterized protein B0I36DRAFT_234919 [Microdochium trichocladiopsis]|uniref:NFX1-type zinc finger-containing protein 1 n=1 Tax=Microdochium trichocladiopsis TaxID=1682393 RepID=A0A9P9BVY3_9PEZI|nr:uncharacterized protein B0I36DRAFT_234919 [Microdochium trichocladiopsis]KAH7040050.1 hypothetical protein B0I36DRAFT_234919 [Microdochium trichocladiopsis]